MNNFEVIYKNGQFIEKSTGKRIIPVQDHEYRISGDENSFSSSDACFLTFAPLNEEDKAIQIDKEYGKGNYVKILEGGSKLYFRLGNSKKLSRNDSLVYYFTCSLLEDLYLYKLRNRKGDKEPDYRLADCQCKLTECVSGGLVLNETLISASLNSLFCNTVMYYFPLQRSGSINVFRTFYVDPSQKKLKLPGIPEGDFNNLESLRLQIVKRINKGITNK